MTVPVTGITPIYGIEYLVEGEPVRHTRVKLQRNAEKIEASLLGVGAPPPGAQDLAELSGRVSALEPTAWVNANLNGGYVPLSATVYHTLRYRRVSGRVECVGTLGPCVAGTITTLPVGFRPTRTIQLAALAGDNAIRQVDINPNGTLLVRFDAPGFLALDFFWPTS